MEESARAGCDEKKKTRSAGAASRRAGRIRRIGEHARAVSNIAQSPGVVAVSLVGTRRPGRNRETLAVAGSLSRRVREARSGERCAPSLIASSGRRPRRREAQLALPKCEGRRVAPDGGLARVRGEPSCEALV